MNTPCEKPSRKAGTAPFAPATMPLTTTLPLHYHLFMSKSKRTTISLPEPVFVKAQALMQARDFTDFSSLIAQLIREEHERRAGPSQVEAVPFPHAAEKPATYKIRKAKG